MKFAKELEHELVPEWRAKYLNYKLAKRKLRAVGRAYHRAGATPRSGLLRRTNESSPFDTGPVYSFLNGKKQDVGDAVGSSNGTAARRTVSFTPQERGSGGTGETNPTSMTKIRSAESRSGRMVRYGSIIGSPPKHLSQQSERGRGPPSLLLPDPAIHPVESHQPVRNLPADGSSHTASATGVSRAGGQQTLSPSIGRQQSRHSAKQIVSTPDMGGSRPFIKRVMSFSGGMKRSSSQPSSASGASPGVELAAYRDLDMRQADFFSFLDEELERIDTFYREKEDEATERLSQLREQLHVMRDRRLEDLIRSRRSVAATRTTTDDNGGESSDVDPLDKSASKISMRVPLERALANMKGIARGGRVGKATKAMEGLATPTGAATAIDSRRDSRRDYTRRKQHTDIPYRTAKRKLKVALQEYYRGLELLKAYAILNRTGFRKINKKYDKTISARPPYRYMSEKVNKSWFVRSDVVDGHIRTVEDLYARYFEQGNHKLAANKLRKKIANVGEFVGSVFRTGCFLAAGLVFGVQGLVYGGELLFSDDATLATQTSFLLQIYAGYFLMALLVLFFCLACRFWAYSKINYIFVFEFDTRHHLNWRQISEIPCICIFLLGFFLWLNFARFGADAMYLYYPVLLIGLTAVMLFLPLPVLYPKTRKWFLYSNWRLLLAGLYPVEFRDFFLGDMYCSQTYPMGNIELFFCLYAHSWSNPSFCNSSHSRLLGFFSTLPGIWRALQCIRRYYDTRNWFPHLANCGKYMCTIMYYLTLSLWRINKTNHLKALFITWACINSAYCSAWDVVMDWSLLDPYSKHKFLRNTLGYKQIWLYYLAMIVDPILRFNWIFYAIFADDVQHSALLSFFVSFSEVCRRGLWMLFRVENEHCTNVGRFRASRDIPLPYKLDSEIDSPPSLVSSSPGETSARTSSVSVTTDNRGSLTQIISVASGTDLEAGPPTKQASGPTPETHHSPSATATGLRRRRSIKSAHRVTSSVTPTLRAVGSMLHNAHAQDYAKKKLRPNADGDASSDDDESGEDEADRLKDADDLEEKREVEAEEAGKSATRAKGNSETEVGGGEGGGGGGGERSGPSRSPE